MKRTPGKRWVSGYLLALLVGALLAGGCERADVAEPDQAKQTAHETAPADAAETAGKVALDDAARTRIGLRLDALAAAQAAAERKAYGRVVDPTVLAEGVTARTIARSAANVASAEAERLDALHSQSRNVSQRALEAAKADAVAAVATADAASARLRGQWGSAIADRADLAAFVEGLVAADQVLVRLDLPGGESLTGEPGTARIETLGGDASVDAPANAISATLVGPAPSVDPATQGRGYYFLVERPEPGLLPGAAVTGYLPDARGLLIGVLVPGSAIVRADGRSWIWLAAQGDELRREPVVLARPLGDGWLVAEPRLVGRRAVVAGAQELLSEDLRDRFGGDEE